ncbi:hypothetical protein [Pseudomonas sp. Q11]|uniref:hypothetical protein n=1 Tax=Pseudomonas sp. Q11 TaxID=2968470 RepID=UPI0035257DD8
MIDEGTIRKVNTEATARLIMGALLGASLWIANAEDPHTASEQVVEGFVALASGLLLAPETAGQ